MISLRKAHLGESPPGLVALRPSLADMCVRHEASLDSSACEEMLIVRRGGYNEREEGRGQGGITEEKKVNRERREEGRMED